MPGSPTRWAPRRLRSRFSHTPDPQPHARQCAWSPACPLQELTPVASRQTGRRPWCSARVSVKDAENGDETGDHKAGVGPSHAEAHTACRTAPSLTHSGPMSLPFPLPSPDGSARANGTRAHLAPPDGRPRGSFPPGSRNVRRTPSAVRVAGFPPGPGRPTRLPAGPPRTPDPPSPRAGAEARRPPRRRAPAPRRPAPTAPGFPQTPRRPARLGPRCGAPRAPSSHSLGPELRAPDRRLLPGTPTPSRGASRSPGRSRETDPQSRPARSPERPHPDAQDAPVARPLPLPRRSRRSSSSEKPAQPRAISPTADRGQTRRRLPARPPGTSGFCPAAPPGQSALRAVRTRPPGPARGPVLRGCPRHCRARGTRRPGPRPGAPLLARRCSRCPLCWSRVSRLRRTGGRWRWGAGGAEQAGAKRPRISSERGAPGASGSTAGARRAVRAGCRGRGPVCAGEELRRRRLQGRGRAQLPRLLPEGGPRLPVSGLRPLPLHRRRRPRAPTGPAQCGSPCDRCRPGSACSRRTGARAVTVRAPCAPASSSVALRKHIILAHV